MAKKNDAIKAEIATFLTEHGYVKDKWGHYKINRDNKTYRFKFNSNKLRYELKCGPRWMMLRSGYWKDLSIGEYSIVGLV